MNFNSIEELSEKLATKFSQELQDYDWDEFVVRWANCIRQSGSEPNMNDLYTVSTALMGAWKSNLISPANILLILTGTLGLKISTTYACLFKSL